MKRNTDSFKKIVIKIGSSLISEDKSLSSKKILDWSKQITKIKNQNKDVVIVTSGAISQGQNLLGIKDRPKELDDLQALAAVGQQQLMSIYEKSFEESGILTAQVLLTHHDMVDKVSYQNAKATIEKILKLNVIPIVNENDVVATEEIRLGDNDTLAAMVCNLINADLMIILTDQDGLFDKDPTTNDDAELIRECKIQDLSISDLEFNSKSKFGTGGFKTKLNSIKIAGTSGTTSIIASGHLDGVISKGINGLEVGTIFFPNKSTK